MLLLDSILFGKLLGIKMWVNLMDNRPELRIGGNTTGLKHETDCLSCFRQGFGDEASRTAPAQNTESTRPTSSHSTSTRSKPQAPTTMERKTISSDYRVLTAASIQATTRPEPIREHARTQRQSPSPSSQSPAYPQPARSHSRSSPSHYG